MVAWYHHAASEVTSVSDAPGQSLEERIRQHIVDNFLYTGDGSSLGNDQSLLESGIVDSTGVLELVFFVEETFGIKVKDEELVPRNFDAIAKLAAYVRTKLAAKAGASASAAATVTTP
jgi:acyl carrier protein